MDNCESSETLKKRQIDKKFVLQIQKVHFKKIVVQKSLYNEFIA